MPLVSECLFARALCKNLGSLNLKVAISLIEMLKFSVSIEMTPPSQVRPSRIQKKTDIR